MEKDKSARTSKNGEAAIAGGCSSQQRKHIYRLEERKRTVIKQGDREGTGQDCWMERRSTETDDRNARKERGSEGRGEAKPKEGEERERIAARRAEGEVKERKTACY